MPESTKSDEAIFAAAIEMSPDQRAAYLDNVCGADVAMRERIEGLLRSHEQAGSFLRNQPVALVATVDSGPLTEAAGTIIGRYKLLQAIGEGGFGVVYMAEQKEPVRRKVALKIIKLGMNSKEVSARFEAERQALALMDHPNIAKVLDAGTTETGRPYFVMELVKGVPIGEFCDKNQLPARKRLEIFTAVCQAVQHAHLKGIIHRDIKPSNVLVTLHDGQPVPKVIDFGVAKALNQELTEKTLFTAFGHMIGTPQYMSPEQAEMSGLDVDTRSDVYSLGVLLYELLTGTTPLEAQKLRKAGYAEMQRLIREEESPRPSVRVSTLGENLSVIAKDRHCEPGSLQQLLRGDLDWIVMKALEKDRARRYDTASAFAADVRRHRSDEVVEARPPSAWYRFRKLARRNKAAMTTAGLMAATLLLGFTVSAWQAVRATRAEDAALTAEAKALAARDQEVEQRQAAVDQRNRAVIAEDEARKSAKLAKDNAAKAEENAALAAKNEQRAKEQASIAQANETKAEVRLYAHYIASAQSEWQSKNVSLFYRNLDQCRPDFRGWEHDYLYTLANRNQKTLLVYSDRASPALRSAAFSPDGKLLATNAWIYDPQALRKELKLWDLATGRELLTFKRTSGFVSSLAFSPDGKRLARASSDRTDKTVELLDAASGEKIWTQQTGSVLDVAFSPDGKLLAGGGGVRANPKTGSGGFGTVTLWDVASGTEVLTLKGHTDIINSVAFSPDGRRLASASQDKTVKLWELASGKEYLTLNGHLLEVRSVAFSPDGKRLASATDGSGGLDAYSGGEVKVWDAASGQEVITHIGHTAVAFSPDGKRLASLSGDNTVKLWDADSGRELQTFLGHKRGIMSVAFSPDGKRLASASWDKTVKLWDADSVPEALGVARRWHVGFVRGIAFSPDGKHLASAGGAIPGQPGQLRLWDASSGEELRKFEGHAGPVWSVAFSPNGKHLASAGGVGLMKPGQVKLWDVASGKELPIIFQGHEDRVTSVAFSPDGKRLATASADQTVKVWDAASGDELLNFQGHEGSCSVTFSPDGKRLAIATGEFGKKQQQPRQVKLLDAASGKELWTFQDNQARGLGGSPSLAFSHDGKRLAIVSRYETIILLDADSGQEIRTFKGHTNSVTSVAFSPDGKRLATASTDKTVKLWDAASGVEVLTLSLAESVGTIAFSPDGKRLACVVGAKGEIIILDASKSETDSAEGCNNLAWMLATGAEAHLRNSSRAVELAKKAVELAPKEGIYWNTLGAAHYRAGDWKAALAALRQSMELSQGGNSVDWFFLAMAHWQLGQKDDARKWYDQAAVWMENNRPRDEEMSRFRAEAAELLGVTTKEP